VEVCASQQEGMQELKMLLVHGAALQWKLAEVRSSGYGCETRLFHAEHAEITL
jgi:hypothetical protein